MLNKIGQYVQLRRGKRSREKISRRVKKKHSTHVVNIVRALLSCCSSRHVIYAVYMYAAYTPLCLCVCDWLPSRARSFSQFNSLQCLYRSRERAPRAPGLRWGDILSPSVFSPSLLTHNRYVAFEPLSLYRHYDSVVRVTVARRTLFWLCPIHTADATELFCRVGVGGVNTNRNKLTTIADWFGRQFGNWPNRLHSVWLYVNFDRYW